MTPATELWNSTCPHVPPPKKGATNALFVLFKLTLGPDSPWKLSVADAEDPPDRAQDPFCTTDYEKNTWSRYTARGGATGYSGAWHLHMRKPQDFFLQTSKRYADWSLAKTQLLVNCMKEGGKDPNAMPTVDVPCLTRCLSLWPDGIGWVILSLNYHDKGESRAVKITLILNSRSMYHSSALPSLMTLPLVSASQLHSQDSCTTAPYFLVLS